MNKKFINGLLLATLMVGSAGTFTSCKDYDDDINDLQGQIDGVIKSIGELQEKIKNGAVIDNVTSNDDGLVITINGKNYTITNGKNGENGAPGTSWSIGANGNWYKDGEDTGLKAVADAGAAGEQGPQGPAGPTGPQGPAGKYYVPNEDGYFWIHEEGKDPEKTNISWVAAGPTAAFTGTELILSNLKDANGKTLDPVTIPLGTNIASLAFIPSKYDNGIPYESFYTLDNKAINLSKNNGNVYETSRNGIAASNVVKFAYRLNPEKAFVAPTATGSFIGRTVEVSRAAGDKEGLLSCGAIETEEGVLYASASLNLSVFGDMSDNFEVGKRPNDGYLGIDQTTDEAVAALRLVNGQNTYTSDYVMVKQSAIKAGLVDRIASSNNKGEYIKGNSPVVAGIYDITRAQNNGEKSTDYIKAMVGATPAVLTEILPYNGTLDMNKVVALLANKNDNGSWNGINYLDVLGFAPEYTFSLPSEYILSASGSTNENQQQFVTLTDGVLAVNTATGATGTQAIGRTPVVRVDARINGQVVATAFVVVMVDRPSADKKTLAIDLGTTDVNYSAIATPFSQKFENVNGRNQNVANFTTAQINSEVYSALGLSPEQFARTYTASKAEIVLKAINAANGKAADYKVQVNVPTTPVPSGDGVATAFPGIYMNGGLQTTGVTTSNPLQIWINNKIHTQEWDLETATNGAYTLEGLASAQYVITITYSASNGDSVVFTKVINVTEDHKGLAFNPNYYANGMVQSYGQLNGSTYEMNFNMGNAFEMLGGKNIFQIEADNKTAADKDKKSINNVAAVNLKMTDCDKTNKGVALVKYDANTHVLAADPALMTAAVLNAQFEYTVTLANGETCANKHSFTTQLINPVKAGTVANAITLDANVTGEQKTSVVPGVLVNNLQNAAVIEWQKAEYDKDGNETKAAGLYLTAAAKAFGYKAGLVSAEAANVKITYAADNSDAYKNFINNLDGAFSVDTNTGEVTYNNKAVLVRDVNFNINATVELNKFSKVTVKIPFSIKK